MNYFGMEKELVEKAILHYIDVHSPNYRVKCITGRFIKRPYGVVYKARGIGSVEVKPIPDLTMEELNSEACMQCIVQAFDTKKQQEIVYLLLSYDDEDAEKRKKGMQQNIAQDYVKRIGGWSKQMAQKIVRLYTLEKIESM